MLTVSFPVLLSLLSCIALTAAHARIKLPKPLAAAPEDPSGNHYNWPLSPDGSQFPCKGLHKRTGVSKIPSEVWRAGQIARFE